MSRHQPSSSSSSTVRRPLLSISPERAAAELHRALEREESERKGGKLLVIAPLLVLAWQLIGAGFLLLSARTPNPALGEALYHLSFAVGAAGGFFSAMVIYVIGAERGEW